jgi:cobaltochelatase CobN
VHDCVIADEARVTTLLDLNAPATSAMAERLKDAIDRRLWTPRRNAVHAELAHVLSGRPAMRIKAEAGE